MSGEDTSQIVEQGDIFFFYRPKVGTEEVSSTEDVQRFYMVTASEENKNSKYRLFILGRKKLPEIVEGKSMSEERNWALNTLTTNNPEDIRKELLAANMKQRQKAREELQQLRQLAKANTLL